MKLQKYHSFIVVEPSNTKRLNDVGVRDAWKLTTQKDPSQRHWSARDGRTRCTLLHREFAARGRSFSAEYTPCREIIVTAQSNEMADNVQSLIFGGMLLAYPDKLKVRDRVAPQTVGFIKREMLTEQPFCSYFEFHENALFGCIAAAKAWPNPTSIYAIEKLKLSLSLDSFTPHSADPRHGQLFSNEHPEFEYHVSAAYAIMTAFAAIEEIGLEVRSSSKNPRFIGPSKDRWNPKVKEDLTRRLDAVGIDHTEPIRWIYRGNPTMIEDETHPKFGSRSPDSDDEEVRDRKMELVDAIHYASWLRNYVAAHRFSSLTTALSPYDVHNVQLLARRLILGTLGLWKKWPTSPGT